MSRPNLREVQIASRRSLGRPAIWPTEMQYLYSTRDEHAVVRQLDPAKRIRESSVPSTMPPWAQRLVRPTGYRRPIARTR